MQVIAGSNEKGGVGKTSILVNLAACLARKGAKVVVVELDRQGSVGEWVKGPDGTRLKVTAAESGKSITPCLADARNALDYVLPTSMEGFDVICADRGLVVARNADLRKVINALAEEYDWAFLDLRRDVEDCIDSVEGLDMRIIVPVRWDAAALTGVEKVLRDMEGRCPTRVIMNFTKHAKLGKLVKRDLFGVSVTDKFVPGLRFSTTIRESSLIGDATNHAEPCVKLYPSEPVSRDLEALAAEVTAWCEGGAA